MQSSSPELGATSKAAMQHPDAVQPKAESDLNEAQPARSPMTPLLQRQRKWTGAAQQPRARFDLLRGDPTARRLAQPTMRHSSNTARPIRVQDSGFSN